MTRAFTLAELPRLGIDPGLRLGRRVHEGYQRGWGIEFGALKDKIRADQDFASALALALGRSVVTEERLMNLFMLIKLFLPRLGGGHIIEYGTYRGGSALFMARLAARFLPGTRVLALDTFAGMPETDRRVDAHGAGDFAETDVEEVREAARAAGLHNVTFIKGRFEDTAGAALAEAGRIALTHIDCDIYSAVRCSYELTKPFMVPGGYYVFDDATMSSCLGATEVVEDIVIARDGLRSEQIYPHFVFRHPEA
ncbi:TylF/MycF/NovP-related O-methyltransferase [Prosthecomicrobium pneumaticum]|uniref:Cephalosporin hydroxylase n=1 Tax=Prosthecomicrobium pneumaticum TaxID=81895 RepID=A0A7W9FQ54_9HYPH|nr:TylF/MycF/NovP-related O-methyltransferase [Prosthecomicrobium pneumaticum]MBB5754827.1 cephalosporin hydroxylase [Prosthecomicrobium pneumaticum]